MPASPTCPTPTPAGKWRATIAASNKHGEGPESALSVEFSVGVTTKPIIASVQVGWGGQETGCRGDSCRPSAWLKRC